MVKRTPPELLAQPASEVQPEPVDWLWQDRIPLGAVSLLVGEPGLGKSHVLIELAARASTGQLSGDLKGEPATVMVASAEDSPAHVLRPRLQATGADLERVELLTVERDGLKGFLTIPGDVELLSQRIASTGARLLCIDPLSAHMGSGIDSHRDQDVRKALAPLVALAEEHQIAVVCVAHLNKSGALSVYERVGGSVAFTALARSVLLVGRDTDDENERLLVHGKSSLAPQAPALRFRIEPREIGSGSEQIKTSGLSWTGKADVTASSLLGAARDTEDDRSMLAECKNFLEQELADGPVAQKELQRRWEDLGLAEKTVRRAKISLRVRSRRGPGGGPWLWELTQGEQGQQSKMANTPPTPFNDHLDHLGHLKTAKTAKTAKISETGEVGRLESGTSPLDAHDEVVRRLLDAFPGTEQISEEAATGATKETTTSLLLWDEGDADAP